MSNMPDRFEDAVVVVTGSTRGIGAAIARRFAREGAAVVIAGRSIDSGEAVVADIESTGGEATFVPTDVRDPDAVEALVETTVAEYGGLDVLVNNAGVETDTGVVETTMDDWDLVLETDFRAYWLAAKHAASYMNTGVILNVSSNHSVVTMPQKFPYNAVKAGIDGMTRAMALDLGPDIRVNTINPGWITVDRTTGEMDEEELATLEAKHPVGRIGRPEDVAGVAAFLASDDAAFVTGANLLVDGGRSVVMQDDTLPNYTA